ncbi:MAG: prolyl oligopeptidase family serine peptidase [bacterium]|nr:prolyl oligopeptidase family serine peptidase [bacterium]
MKTFIRKKPVLIALLSIASVFVLCLIFTIYLRSIDPDERLLKNYSGIISTDILNSVSTEKGITYDLHLKGEKIPLIKCVVRVPAGDKPLPLMIILGGVERGRDVINLVADVDLASKFIFASFDYPYDGKMSKLSVIEFLTAVPAIREACFNTVPAILMLIDHLETLEEVDSENIFVTGGSFGSFFAIAAAALDQRIKAAASLYGGGDIAMLIRENSKEVPSFLRGTAGYLAESLLYPVEPLRHIHRIAPRHVLIVNGKNDRQIPRESVQKLYNKAGQPKSLIWFDSDHIHPTKRNLLSELTEVVAEWVIENDLIEH